MGPSHCLMFKSTFYNKATKVGRLTKVVNRGKIMSLFFITYACDLILMTYATDKKMNTSCRHLPVGKGVSVRDVGSWT